MNGLLMVEAPIGALEFDNYQARVRLTQVVRNREGKVVWQAKKDVTLKSSSRRIEERRSGNICYLRELKLPAGHYALEGKVEDLVSGKSAEATEALRASDNLPGFALSDAMFVRKLDDSVDKFEADQVLSYDGTALAPMLEPVFRANAPMDVQIYFVIYPDPRGAPPRISLEIRRDGQAVGRSEIPFTDSVASSIAGGGQGMDMKGEQKHEFPFLAKIVRATFEAGQYEAHVTVRQGDNAVTRIVPFRVVAR